MTQSLWRAIALAAMLAILITGYQAEEIKSGRSGKDMHIDEGHLLPYSATTTAAPAANSEHQIDDDDDEAQSDSTADDFEDTLPDDASPASGPSDAVAGLSKALDLFETLTTVWQSVNDKQPTKNVAPAADTSDRQMTEEKDVAEGRYIKGDPLKGYYDFIITEGSYKFWAVFQLITALLMIYSTFAAIYYSKVNPIVSDYDYVSYLGGRSLGSASAARSADGDEGAHPLASLLNAGWMQSAAHGFEWVLDAVERIPA